MESETTPRAARWTFGEFELDEGTHELRRSGAPVKIQRKPLDVLLHLVQHRNRTVPRSELLSELWPGIHVSEEALASALRDLRRAIGDTNRADPMVQTLRGHGYRFVAKVTPGRATSQPRADVRIQSRPSSVVPSSTRAFVDREHVMQSLLGALNGAARGDTRISFLAGPPGIGKTRAAEELVREAESRGIEAHVGCCYEGGGATAFWPWLNVVRACIANCDPGRLRSSLGASLPYLAWIAPELVPAGGAEGRGDLDGAEARFRLFDAVTLFLKRVTEEQPLLIVLEDLHWGDEASLLLLEFVVQGLRDARLHIVGTFRDVGREHTLTRVLGASARRPFAQRIDLSGLHQDSVKKLLGTAAHQEPSSAFADAVFAATAGNPFFVVEVTRLVASGALDVTDETGTVPVPVRARDAIRLQIERLPPGCEALLALASVAGHEFPSTVLAHAAQVSPARALELLDAAESAGLLSSSRDAPGKFWFVHDLVKDTIRQGLGTVERVRLHRRLAETLESFADPQDPARLREVAFHYAEAAADGVACKAVEFSRRAAEQAHAGMAFEDAVHLYERALESLSLLPSPAPRQRCELLLGQAEAAWGTSEDAARVQERFVKAATAARRAEAPDLLARAALGRSGYRAGSGDYRDIFGSDPTDIELLSEARDALGSERSALRAFVLARLAISTRYSAGLESSRALSSEAVELGEQLGDVEVLGTVLRYHHEVLSTPEFARERLKLAQRILDLARQARSRPLELDALFFLSRANFELGDPGAAFQWGAAAEALSVTMRHPGAHFRSGIRQVLIATLLGKFDEAERLALECFERDASRNLNALGTFNLQRCMFAMLQLEHVEAIRRLEAIEISVPALPWRRHALAAEHAFAGERDVARELFERAAARGFADVQNDHTQLGSLLLLADTCAELGDQPRAGELYEKLAPYANRMVAPFLTTICQGSVDRALGTLSGVLGRWEDAELHFASALHLEESCRSAPLVALSLERHGAMLLARGRPGDRDRARERLGRAAALRERMSPSAAPRPAS